MISRTRTPKLKTSDFTENTPCITYSGAMYPLKEINTTFSVPYTEYNRNFIFQITSNCIRKILLLKEMLEMGRTH